MTIYKFPAPINDEVALSMPVGAVVLSVALQAGEPVLWALVTPTAGYEQRRFHWRGTGHPADGLGRFIGTVLMHGGVLVFHLFEAATP